MMSRQHVWTSIYYIGECDCRELEYLTWVFLKYFCYNSLDTASFARITVLVRG